MKTEELLKYLQSKYDEAEKEYNNPKHDMLASVLYQGMLYAYMETINYIKDNG